LLLLLAGRGALLLLASCKVSISSASKR
jgi:hypothetical protein